MGIKSTGGKLHWNYFVALDRDMETVSRYIEFADDNLKVYSLELAHLLFAAASEVDVVAKLICKQLDPKSKANNINAYRTALMKGIPTLPSISVLVPRYGMEFKPWQNWGGKTNPAWWRAYNNVKHERNRFFREATLKNTLNAMGGLLILTYYFYFRDLGLPANALAYPKEVTRHLTPESSLIRFPESWYDVHLIV